MLGLSVKEASEQTGLTPLQLRDWDRIGLVIALRDDKNHRRYGPREMGRLQSLKAKMDRERLTPSEVRLTEVAAQLEGELPADATAVQFLRLLVERTADGSVIPLSRRRRSHRPEPPRSNAL